MVAVHRTGNTTHYEKVAPNVSGTVTIDSVASLTTGGAPAVVQVVGCSHDGVNAFELTAVLAGDGALASSGILYNTAGIREVRVQGGNLEVTPINYANYLFSIDVRSFSSTVGP